MSKLVEHNQLVKKYSVMLALSGVINLARTILWSFSHPRPFWAWGTNLFASLWTYVQHYGRVPNLKKIYDIKLLTNMHWSGVTIVGALYGDMNDLVSRLSLFTAKQN